MLEAKFRKQFPFGASGPELQLITIGSLSSTRDPLPAGRYGHGKNHGRI